MRIFGERITDRGRLPNPTRHGHPFSIILISISFAPSIRETEKYPRTMLCLGTPLHRPTAVVQRCVEYTCVCVCVCGTRHIFFFRVCFCTGTTSRVARRGGNVRFYVCAYTRVRKSTKQKPTAFNNATCWRAICAVFAAGITSILFTIIFRSDFT